MTDEQATMHCPGCGTEAPLTQKFCRSCGLSLEKITQAVVEQLSSHELLPQTDKLQKRQRTVERSLVIVGFGFGSLLAMSFFSGLIYLMAVGNLPILPGVVLLLIMLSAIIAGSLAVYSERLRKTLAKPELVKTRALPQGDSQPGDYDGPLISVTERTTNLLEANANTSRTSGKEGGA